MNPLLLVDYYKTEHNKMYPKGITMVYSNLTARKSRLKGVDKVVFFTLQHFIKEYLIKLFNKEFFKKEDIISYASLTGWSNERASERIKKDIIEEYKRHINVDTKHIEALWDLGYLPIEIKAVEEGTQVPIGVPMLTIKNTHPDFAWLTNYLETLMSCQLWQGITSATIAYEYKKLLSKYAKETTGSTEFVQWQGHDFSMRGMSSVESAILSGMAHLTCFTGTDTIPAIYALENSYNATGLIGASVPATEHSVMCAHGKGNEKEMLLEHLKIYPTGILSEVMDTWDLWWVITKLLPDPDVKKAILSRDGKLVIRPDSGDPVDIVCGLNTDTNLKYAPIENGEDMEKHPSYKGVIELLWDIFGGTVNDLGYKVLDSHIGAIYGDSITLERAEQICERLKAKGFASTNIVLGIGSYTYQYNTRDTFGMAIKSTYCEVNGEGREIFKDPVTDDGTKKSAKGLLMVHEHTINGKTNLVLRQQCDPKWIEQGYVPINHEEDDYDQLQTVFKDGKLVKEINLEEIRQKLTIKN